MDEGHLSQDEDRLSTADTGDHLSSTDAGDDVDTIYVDLDDFTDATSSNGDGHCSDGESSNDHGSLIDTAATATTCIYSVMMLLNLRNTVCKDGSTTALRFGTKSYSELPAEPEPKSPSKARTTRTVSDSWRASPGAPADSWRPALPESKANSWVAQKKHRDTDEDANVLRAARSILNKLTIEKFDALFEQLTMCGFTQPHHISMLMREVFEKATTQHHFIPMYAELCVQLEKDPRIASAVDEADPSQNFRRLLLNQCQSVFEQVLESHVADEDADEEAAYRRKQEVLGNMKLIGRLLVHGMLSSDLFPQCCEELLRRRSDCTEALEALVALMMVAGPKFDHCSWQYHKRLGNILSDMQALTKDKTVPPRLRFLIRDVLDARSAGWPSTTGGATKLEDVRIAAEGKVAPKAEGDVESWCPSADAKDAKGKKKRVKFNFKESSEPEQAAPAPAPPAAFEIVTFRKALAVIFSDLASDKNIPGAVQRVRLQQVPLEFQADQFVDILTRVVEERRGAVRRCELAFLAGLAAAEESAFDRKECLNGIALFFKDVYGELCNEVHRLPAIMKSEFMPTVVNVFPVEDLNKVVPPGMRK